MGDRAWTAIKFSGKCNIEVAGELVEALKNQSCECTNGPEDDLTVEHLREPHNQFYDDDCNYATMEGVENFCTENGISYLKVWAAGGDYAAGYEIYNAVVNQVFQVEGQDEPTLTVSQLAQMAEEGRTLADAVTYLETFTNWEENYPPLEIVE